MHHYTFQFCRLNVVNVNKCSAHAAKNIRLCPLSLALCQIWDKLAASLLTRWVFSFLTKRSKNNTNDLKDIEATLRVEAFRRPEDVAAYARRLETTSLPFAIDAAHIINLVPPTNDSSYGVLDNACGSGALIEWLVKELTRNEVPFSITGTDYSALMMNEVQNRRERLGWGGNVKTTIMDAQV